MKPTDLLLLPLLLAPLPAAAETLLHLSETAHVTVFPDELAATVQVSATAGSAADVQAKVNTAMHGALEQVHAVKEVVASTGGYQVYLDQSAHWNGQQSIQMHSLSGDTLLKLVGVLQSQGMTVTQLGWRVAAETARKARDAATKEALGHLRGRAEDAAGILGLRFSSFRDVRLDSAPFQPVMPRIMMAAAPTGRAPAPSAEAEEVQIDATVQADVALTGP